MTRLDIKAISGLFRRRQRPLRMVRLPISRQALGHALERVEAANARDPFDPRTVRYQDFVTEAISAFCADCADGTRAVLLSDLVQAFETGMHLYMMRRIQQDETGGATC